MKRKNAYIFVLAALILINAPMSVMNTAKWEESLYSLCRHAVDKAFSIPTQEKTEEKSLFEKINTAVLSSAISVLEYGQENTAAENVITEDINTPPVTEGSTADMGTGPYKDSSVDYSKLHSGNPKVLIYHTHTTESYLDSPTHRPGSWRSTDPEKNLITVGSIVSKVLNEEYGVEVLYISDIFDRPYDTAYDRSGEAVKKAVAKYPGIEYIFDIHRDGLADKEGNRDIYLTNINGVDCASIMFVLSTKSPYIKEMREFGDVLKNKMDEMYPSLYRKTMDRNYCYNMLYSPNSMLFEVGSNLTTIDEAKNTAVYLGRVLGEIITENIKE